MKLIFIFLIGTQLYSQGFGTHAGQNLNSSTPIADNTTLSFLTVNQARPEASNSNFTISATPTKVPIVLGGSGIMTVSQSNPAFTGTISYSILNLTGITSAITMAGNTAKVTLSAPLSTPLGTRFGILARGQSGSN